MNQKTTFGIRQKLIVVLMTVLLFALSLSGWLALKKERKTIDLETQNRGNDITRFVAKSMVYSVIGYDYETIELLLKEITKSEEIKFARVENKSGKEMGVSGVLNEKNRESTRLFKKPIILDGETIGELTLGLSTKKRHERLKSNTLSLVTREALIILLIAIGEFVALSFIIIKPVKLISSSLEKNANGQGKILMIPLDSNDEFGQLAKKFNQLGNELNAANNKLRQRIDTADNLLKVKNSELLKQQAELEEVNKELHKMAITDPLTSLYNRRHFENLITIELNNTLRYGDKNSLIIIDIDNFKTINDTYGHLSGDIVLKIVSETLNENLRKSDVLCRIGGEEFAVLCKKSGKEESIKIAEKLRLAIQDKPVFMGSESINVTISLGVSSIPNKQNTKNIDEFYRFADVALYHCKNNGRNNYTHYDDLDKQTTNQSEE